MERNVPEVDRDDLIDAFIIFAEAVDGGDVVDGVEVDATYILNQISDGLGIVDAHHVVALFTRCVALQNAAEESFFAPSDEGAIPDLAVKAACLLPVYADSDEEISTVSFQRDQFVNAMLRGS